MFEAKTLSAPPEPDAMPDAQVPVVSDIQASGVEAVEVEVSDAEMAEVALAERPPLQPDETTFIAEVVPPPLPKRRLQMQKKPALQAQKRAGRCTAPL